MTTLAQQAVVNRIRHANTYEQEVQVIPDSPAEREDLMARVRAKAHSETRSIRALRWAHENNATLVQAAKQLGITTAAVYHVYYRFSHQFANIRHKRQVRHAL